MEVEQVTGLKVRAAQWMPEGDYRRMSLGNAVNAIRTEQGTVWLDLVVLEEEAARELLERQLSLHPLGVHDSLTEEERPSLHEAPNLVFFTLPVLVIDGQEFLYYQLGVFVGRTFLVTVSSQSLGVVSEMFSRSGRHPIEKRLSPSLLAHSLVDAVVDDYFPATDLIEAKIEAAEEKIYSSVRPDAREALQTKRDLLDMRRQVTPLRDILNTLLRRDITVIAADVKPYFQDAYDHSLRVVENIDLNRDILTTLLDAQLNLVSNRLNEVMRTLTVISTVLMSSALIAGVYGMNFRHFPELSWPFGYPFAIFLMVIVGLIEVWAFRRKGWI